MAYLLALTYAYFSGIQITNPYEILEGLILVSTFGGIIQFKWLTDLDIDRKIHTKTKLDIYQNEIDKKWIVFFSGS